MLTELYIREECVVSVIKNKNKGYWLGKKRSKETIEKMDSAQYMVKKLKKLRKKK